MLPIPLRVLIHEATLNEVVRDDYGAEQDMSNPSNMSRTRAISKTS